MLMFALLITVLVMAVFTDVKKDADFQHELGIGNHITENSIMDVANRDSIK